VVIFQTTGWGEVMKVRDTLEAWVLNSGIIFGKEMEG
jgi:hypothetical protein